MRSDAAEWLDANGHSSELPAYLHDLAWLNRVGLGPWAIVRWLKHGMRQVGGKNFGLIDVGCGDGALLRTINRWAMRNGFALELAGIDFDPNTIALACARTSETEAIVFQVADVFEFTPARRPDFIVSSLLAHHLDDERIVEFIRWLNANARHGWLIYDLQRSAILHRSIGLIGRPARLHPMVVHDGQISVTRSLTRAEWRDRIRAAGLDPAQVRIDWFLYRLLVSRLRVDDL